MTEPPSSADQVTIVATRLSNAIDKLPRLIEKHRHEIIATAIARTVAGAAEFKGQLFLQNPHHCLAEAILELSDAAVYISVGDYLQEEPDVSGHRSSIAR